ncbi:Uroporphyrinogen decarboxylase [Methanimicrococcus stummii]|uniref:Uroporphyrinogen decarboxylase n=1 Tax=Methanimicrococcus stummii TaxID=3028294 RepID=A0AA96ZYA3_9EURY|nr:methylcobamide:CoM methyltransferase MtaA [Methanimicrococcus sp. Es2]WNY28626.1 Uroporphyrinogen decarboxylase [Methanimicrococcus sp. Es2]
METMTMLERFTKSLQLKEVDKIPVCSVTQTGTMELMELTGTSWPKAFTDPKEMAALAMAGYEIAGLEGVRYPFSSPDIPQAFGCAYSSGTFNSPPHQLDFPCQTPEEVLDLTIPEDLYESPGIKSMIETTDILRRQIDEKGYELPLIAGILGPASFASCIAGVNNYLMWSVKEQDALQQLINLGGEVCAEYANVLYDHGADSVVIIDSESGPDLFPPPLFEPMFLSVYQKMAKTMKGLNILHMCGDATVILDPLAKSGFHGLSIEEKTSMKYASQTIGDQICLIGNISPSDELLLQSLEVVKKAAKQCIEDGVRILAPGCGIAPYTPLANLKAFVAARDEYYAEKESV